MPQIFALLLAASALVSPAHLSLGATPGTLAEGAPLTLSGRLASGGARVDLYFQRYGTIGFVLATHAATTGRGRFLVRVPARASGTWKAVDPVTGETRQRAVQVLRDQPRQLAAYGGTTRAWRGPAVLVPTTRFKAVATYRCLGDGFFSLDWNGQEDATSDRRSGTVTVNGRTGGRRGHFEVSTWEDCSWSLRVFSGSVTVQV
jgi:hypothetical protein